MRGLAALVCAVALTAAPAEAARIASDRPDLLAVSG
jgi:hypothetical protein